MAEVYQIGNEIVVAADDDEIYGEEDIYGDDDGDPEIGWFRKKKKKKPMVRRLSGGGLNPNTRLTIANPLMQPGALPNPMLPGASVGGPKRVPFGLAPVVFTSSSGALLSAITTFQEVGSIVKFVVVESRAGTTAPTAIVAVNQVYIGGRSQLPALSPFPASMLSATAEEVALRLQPIGSGMQCKVELTLQGAALTGDQTITVSVGGFVDTVG